eukprot:413752-Rhodomonas_salina.1
MPHKLRLLRKVRILRVLFTGGPNGGKTSALERVRVALAAHNTGDVYVYCAPEAATAVLQCMGPGVRELVAGDGAGSVFQASILGVQYAAEQGAELFALAMKEQLAGGDYKEGTAWVVLLFDRGLGDGLAFIGGKQEWAAAEASSGIKLDRETFRVFEYGKPTKHPTFDLVLHMQSRAAAQDESVRTAYERVSVATETERLHNAAASAEADAQLAKVYGLHPGYHLVSARTDFDGKCTEAVQLIQGKMGTLL